MSKILEMSQGEIVFLDPEQINWQLSAQEILYIFKVLGGLWLYDYDAAKEGRVGLHAKLKSERCSDGFLYSKIVLKNSNIRTLMAKQLVSRFNELDLPKPDRVAGIPKGATKLGIDFARIMGVEIAEMAKEDGCIKMITTLKPNETLLLIEDFCTKGTGFKEAVRDIKSKQPDVIILPIEPVIINRGGFQEIQVDGIGSFKIIAAAEHRINDWDPSECPLCEMGSERIKPKAVEENWERIMTSQLT